MGTLKGLLCKYVEEMEGMGVIARFYFIFEDDGTFIRYGQSNAKFWLFSSGDEVPLTVMSTVNIISTDGRTLKLRTTPYYNAFNISEMKNAFVRAITVGTAFGRATTAP